MTFLDNFQGIFFRLRLIRITVRVIKAVINATFRVKITVMLMIVF